VIWILNVWDAVIEPAASDRTPFKDTHLGPFLTLEFARVGRRGGEHGGAFLA